MTLGYTIAGSEASVDLHAPIRPHKLYPGRSGPEWELMPCAVQNDQPVGGLLWVLPDPSAIIDLSVAHQLGGTFSPELDRDGIPRVIGIVLVRQDVAVDMVGIKHKDIGWGYLLACQCVGRCLSQIESFVGTRLGIISIFGFRVARLVDDLEVSCSATSWRGGLAECPHVAEILSLIDAALRAQGPQAGGVAVQGQLVAAARFGNATHRATVPEERLFRTDDASVSIGPCFILRDADLDERMPARSDQRRPEDRHQFAVDEPQTPNRSYLRVSVIPQEDGSKSGQIRFGFVLNDDISQAKTRLWACLDRKVGDLDTQRPAVELVCADFQASQRVDLVARCRDCSGRR
jgi:hypothetical protein